MDPELLEALDASEEVRREGRSAVLRRAVADYLDRQHRMQIREAYRRAYGEGGGEPDELEGWADEGSWPDE